MRLMGEGVCDGGMGVLHWIPVWRGHVLPSSNAPFLKQRQLVALYPGVRV